MEDTIQKTKHVTDDLTTTQVALSQCRTAFMAGITLHFLHLLMKESNLPEKLNRNVLRESEEQIYQLVRELRRTAVDHLPSYMDRNLENSKILDMATLVDIIGRIGVEMNDDVYEEFFGLVVDCIDAVFYAQQNRRNLHFGKYKALFKLFTDEVKADVNKQIGQVLYTADKKLFLRTGIPVQSPEIR